MGYLKLWILAILVVFLSACGGGGNPGSGSTSVTTPTPISTSPTLTLVLTDAAGTTLAFNSISKNSNYYSKATVADAKGAPLANALVSFSTDYTVATVGGGVAGVTALTDSNGVAKVLISPLTITTSGAATLTAAAYINGTSVTGSLNFGTSASNVSLASMTTSASTIGALETDTVTVVGLVNGTASAGVIVNFSALCGAFSPASATTNSSGVAVTTFQSDVSCGTLSPVSLTASAVGAATGISKSIVVTPAKAANIVFTSATPVLMYVSSAASGNKTSIVKFQVVNSNGIGISSPPQNVMFSLSQAAIDAGVKFSVSGTSTAQTSSTNSNGDVSIQVAAGTVPTPVAVTATLVTDSTIFASSLGLAVTTGAATQNAASLSATKLSIEAWNTDNVQTSLSIRVADRMANPVPDGTIVNFVANAGLVTGTCSTVNSACSVTFTSQGTRPINGRVAILAYLNGEESFIDSNGDNVWQSGESFHGVGRAFIDTNEDGIWQAGEQIIGTSSGSSACFDPLAADLAIPNTCGSSSLWSGNILVRRQITITLATSVASITQTSATRTATGFRVWVHDTNANANANGNVPRFNAMPTGSTIGATVVTTGATCTVKAVSPNLITNSTDGDFHDIVLSGDGDCTTVRVNVSVTTPGGTTTTQPF